MERPSLKASSGGRAIVQQPTWSMGFLFLAEASFSAYLFAFLKGKNGKFWPFRGKRRQKGRRKHDRNWSCFFGLKTALFPQLKAKFCLKGRQKTRPWPYFSIIFRSLLFLVSLFDLNYLDFKGKSWGNNSNNSGERSEKL